MRTLYDEEQEKIRIDKIKRTVNSKQETTFQHFLIESLYTGSKEWSASPKYPNKNHHFITVTNQTSKKSITFDYWQSIKQVKNASPKDLLFAFRSFLEDAISGDQTFKDFCDDFGYNNDSIKDQKIYSACQDSLDKAHQIGVYNISDLLETLSNEGIE